MMAEHKDEKSFEVRYQYYQYNDGLANNGNKSGKEEFNTVELAQQFIDKINKSINNKLSDKEDKEFIREYIESRRRKNERQRMIKSIFKTEECSAPFKIKTQAIHGLKKS